MAEKLRIMLVDDHYLVRVGLASILALEPDMTVCAEASTGEQAIQLFRTHRPDVTLMDLRLSGVSGSEATRAIHSEFPDARIIVISTYICDEEIYNALQAGAMAYLVKISTYICDEEIYNALQAGAMAYLVKSVQREELIKAIRKAAIGQRHIPPEVAARLAERVGRSQLSVRELDVLRLLVGGKRNRVIASELDVTEGTVKLHVSSILGKLGVADRTEAVTVALQRGIVQLGN